MSDSRFPSRGSRGQDSTRGAACWGLCLLLLLAAGCRSDAATPAKPPQGDAAKPKPETAAATQDELTHTFEVPCRIEGDEHARLMARVEGVVGKVHVDIGDEVRKGQPLVELDVPEVWADVGRRRRMVTKAEADVRSRHAELEQARAQLSEQQAERRMRESELKRIKTLVEGGAVREERRDEAQFALESVLASIERRQADILTAEAHIDAAEAKLDVAKADLKKTEVMAAYTSIQAPFDGLITERMVDPGDFVRPAGGRDAKPLVEIVSVEKLRAVVHVPRTDAAQLDAGHEVKIHGIHSLPGEVIQGTITRYAKAFDRQSHMMLAEVDLDNPVIDSVTGRRRLKAGDYGKMTIVTQRASGPSIPRSAIFRHNEEDYVLVVDPEDHYSMRRVQVELLGEKTAILASGVHLDERVVTEKPAHFQHELQLCSESNHPSKGSKEVIAR